MSWIVEFIEIGFICKTTSDGNAFLVTILVITSHLTFLPITDIERTLLVHGQPVTIDVVDDNLRLTKRRRTTTRPKQHASIASIANMKGTSLSMHDHINWKIQLILSFTPDR